MKRLRSACRKNAFFLQLNQELLSPYFVFLLALMAIVAGVLSHPVVYFVAGGVLIAYICLFADETYPAAAVAAYAPLVHLIARRPSYGAREIALIAIGAGADFLLLILRTLSDREERVGRREAASKRGRLWLGLLLFAAAILFCGMGYDEYYVDRLPVSLLTIALLMGFYLIFRFTVERTRLPKDYFAWVSLGGGIILSLAIVHGFATERVFVGGEFVRDWASGMGDLIVIMIPGTVCLAKDRRCGWFWMLLGFAQTGCLLLAGSPVIPVGAIVLVVSAVAVLANSRGSRLIGNLAPWLFLGIAVCSVGMIDPVVWKTIGEALLPEQNPEAIFEGYERFLDSPFFGMGIEVGRTGNVWFSVLLAAGAFGAVTYGAHRIQTIVVAATKMDANRLFLLFALLGYEFAGALWGRFFDPAFLMTYSSLLFFIESYAPAPEGPLLILSAAEKPSPSRKGTGKRKKAPIKDKTAGGSAEKKRRKKRPVVEMSLWDEPYRKVVSGIKSVEMRLYDEKRRALAGGDKT
ncbi:MAG: hypothetical protein ACI4U2_04225, partial [Christensenellaceae bacterium]